MLSLTQKQIDRFWGYVDKNKSMTFYNGSRCWEWTAHCLRGEGGYGQIEIFGKGYLSHRLSYELTFGEIPDGLMVLHHCDNRPCCNPNHLFLGTNRDNIDDMMRKGRQSMNNGEKNGNHILTNAQIEEIRKRYKPFSLQNNTVTLAREFGVSQGQIWNIVNHKQRIT